MSSFSKIKFITNSVFRLKAASQLIRKDSFKLYSNQGRNQINSASRRNTYDSVDRTENTFSFGRGMLAGGSLLGIGMLCYYGLGLSDDVGALEKSAIWPRYVKDRIKATYMYFGSSIVITSASAVLAFSSPAIRYLVSRGGFLGLVLTYSAIIGTGILCQGIPYKKGFGAKQLAWMFHTAVMGAMLSPILYVGGPVLIRAAWYTAGVIGGLSAIAVCAPSEKFLNLGGPLAMGLGVVFASSIATMFLSPLSTLGAGAYAISMYGGLLLFSGFLLFDTQMIIAQAERYPPSPEVLGLPPYDPVNASLSIYMDTLNIFIRIAMILASGGGSKRR